MALTITKFNLDINPGLAPPIINVSEYDINRQFIINLTENGKPFEIPSNVIATVEGTLNQRGFQTTGIVNNNTVSFTLTETMTASRGRAWTKIKLVQDNKPISTCGFWLDCDRAGVEADTVIGAPGFEEQIRDAAGAWLEEQGFSSPTIGVTEITGGHRVTVTDYEGSESFDIMDGEDTGVVTDTTLTVSGAAADSKTVGDILGAGEYALGNPGNWVRQYIVSGVRQSSENRIATEGYLPKNVTHVTCASGYSSLVHRYTTSGEHAGFWMNGGFVTQGSGEYRQEFDIPQDSYRYVLVLKKNDNATITTDAAVNITSDADGESTEGLIQRVEALERGVIATDGTLSVAGMAADAAAVGEILGTGAYNIKDTSKWAKRYWAYASNQWLAGTTSISLIDVLPSEITRVEWGEDHSGALTRWTSNDQFAGAWDGSDFVMAALDTPNYFRGGLDIPQNTNYGYRISFGRVPRVEIDTTEAAVVTAIADQIEGDGLIQKVAAMGSHEMRISALESKSVSYAPLQGGAFQTTTGATGNARNLYDRYRLTAKPIRVSNRTVSFRMDSSDAALVSQVIVYQYTVSDSGRTVALVDTKITDIPLSGNQYTCETLDPAATHVKIILALTADTRKTFKPLILTNGETEKDFNAINVSFEDIVFLYPVSGDHFTTGQLILPPNYSQNGDPVPLYVAVHGTGAMYKWTDKMGLNASLNIDGRHLARYMANEGFAVFDCYPWTDEYVDDENGIISPYAVTENKMSYIEGIKYVCDRFNIDINNVCMSFKSLGGSLGYWFTNQTYIKPKAIAMLAPSPYFGTIFWDTYFLRKNVRQLLVNKFGLSGVAGATEFINTEKGIGNATVKAFMDANLDAFAGMNPAGIGLCGASQEELFEWMVTKVSTLPQWMQDKSLPDLTSYGAPAYIEHPELSKPSLYPVKFWHAFDDVNVSAHANYTVYRWMLNGGSDVQWRTMPNGTGGHSSFDTSPNAPKSSGTTRQGVAFTDIATAYVEMADFFFEKMCMD